MTYPSAINLTAAGKLWAIDLLRRLADEMEHADRPTLADALMRLPLHELAGQAAKLFPALAALSPPSQPFAR